MCGIYGFVHLANANAPDPKILDRMGASLNHRGPDGSGAWIDGNVAFGHRRLKIIDLSDHARQPMSNQDDTIWVTFNGEIYNYQEQAAILREKGYQFKSTSDTEVIIHLYEEYGIDCLKYLTGMFAFALWDKRKRVGYLVRDRLGIKPLHYAAVNGKFIFASEIKALMQHPDIAKAIDLRSLSQYLSFDYVPAPYSIFSQVRKIEPGHYIKISQEEIAHVRYWAVEYNKDRWRRSEDEYANELLSILERSVRRHLVSDVPLGAFLSGGIDSSTVCMLMRKLGVSQIKTFHIGFDEASFDETKYAKKVADFLETDHYSDRLSVNKAKELIPEMMKYLDEPFGDASFIPTLLLSQFTRQHVTVSLSGDGGDEVFAGYPTYQAHVVAEALKQTPNFLWRWMLSGVKRLPVSDQNISLDFQLKKFADGMTENSIIERHYRWLGSFSGAAQNGLLSENVRMELNEFEPYRIAKLAHASSNAPNWLDKILSCDQRFFLQDDMLVKIDRASMAASLEARVPFLDHEVVEFAAKLPADLKMKNLITKYILKRAVKGKLPALIIDRKKKGFGIPLARWFKADLKNFLLSVFDEAKIHSEGFFDPKAVSRLLKDHFDGRLDNRKQIYTLLNFELWYQKYIKTTA